MKAFIGTAVKATDIITITITTTGEIENVF
jgi:hypothetical protein